MRADRTRTALGAGVLVAAVSHGAIAATLAGAALVTWWALPLHLACVWLAGSIARSKGRDPNIGHAAGIWLVVIGPVLALRLADSDRFETHQPVRLPAIVAAVVAGAAIVVLLALLVA